MGSLDEAAGLVYTGTSMANRTRTLMDLLDALLLSRAGEGSCGH